MVEYIPNEDQEFQSLMIAITESALEKMKKRQRAAIANNKKLKNNQRKTKKWIFEKMIFFRFFYNSLEMKFIRSNCYTLSN